MQYRPARRAIAVLLMAAFVVLFSSSPLLAQPASVFRQEIDRILASSSYGSDTGVAVVNLHTTQALYVRNTQKLFVPASNMKLVTAATALVRLGPDYRFTTTLLTDAEDPTDGVLKGNLYLRGTGDPTLATTDYARRRLKLKTSDINGFAAALVKAGIREVRGDLVADESAYDSIRTGQGWKRSYWAECPPLSALSVNQNYRDMLTFQPVANPAENAAALLHKRLRGNGISLTGKIRVAAAPADARPLHTESSAQLAEILRLMNKDSDNFIAEMILKHLGLKFKGHGTSFAGTAVEREFLSFIGISPMSVRIIDGSGLSPHNRVTPWALVQLEYFMAGHPYAGHYAASLPLAGVDGTLKKRMFSPLVKGNLQGKTGFIRGASALSGYVRTSDGEVLAYSILVNSSPLNVLRAKELQDRLGQYLAAAAN